MPTTFRKGQRVFFTYRCWESEQSADAELWHHTRQSAVILHKIPLSKGEEITQGGKMYRIMFKDGFEYDVTNDEIQPLSTRPALRSKKLIQRRRR